MPDHDSTSWTGKAPDLSKVVALIGSPEGAVKTVLIFFGIIIFFSVSLYLVFSIYELSVLSGFMIWIAGCFFNLFVAILTVNWILTAPDRGRLEEAAQEWFALIRGPLPNHPALIPAQFDYTRLFQSIVPNRPAPVIEMSEHIEQQADFFIQEVDRICRDYPEVMTRIPETRNLKRHLIGTVLPIKIMAGRLRDAHINGSDPILKCGLEHSFWTAVLSSIVRIKQYDAIEDFDLLEYAHHIFRFSENNALQASLAARGRLAELMGAPEADPPQ